MIDINQDKEFWVEINDYTRNNVKYIFPAAAILNLLALFAIDFQIMPDHKDLAIVFRLIATIALSSFFFYSQFSKSKNTVKYQLFFIMSFILTMLPGSFLGAQSYIIENSFFVGVMALLQVEFTAVIIAPMRSKITMAVIVFVNLIFISFHFFIDTNIRPEKASEVIVGTLIFAVLSYIINFIMVKAKYGEYLKRKELERVNIELADLNSTKDKLFSIISHDLVNPVQSLQLGSEVLNHIVRKNNYSEVESKSLSMSISIQQFSDLLMNLLFWSRSILGKSATNPYDLNLDDLVKQVIAGFEHYITSKNLNIINDVEDIIVHCDRELLKISLRNLISNAIKYSEVNSKILISSYSLENHIEIHINDEGIGMSTEHLDSIFNSKDPIYHSQQHNNKGTGLGLLVSKDSIGKNGGSLQITSKLHYGTKVSFTIPRTS
jgi:signal transduction histidine kinase